MILLKKVALAPGVKVRGVQSLYTGSLVDIAIAPDGTVEQIGKDLIVPHQSMVLECQGMLVSPGWIDLHTHIYVHATDFSLEPALVGPTTGVLSLVDAGSAGEANFAGLVRYVLEPSTFPILAFLNIGSIGLTAANRISEVAFPGSIDVERTVECARCYPRYVAGIKVRSCAEVLGEAGLTPLESAIKAAEELGLPVVVHVGRAEPSLPHILRLLRSGDMVTHSFHGKDGNTFLDHERKVREAAARGVWFDVGHGAASFSYEVAEYAVSAGFLPDTISTDLHAWNVNGPVWNLASTMSKMLSLGMPLESVIASVTSRPAEFLRRPEWGDITVGNQARLTLFALEGGQYLPDSSGKKRWIEPLIIPKYAVLGAHVIQAERK